MRASSRLTRNSYRTARMSLVRTWRFVHYRTWAATLYCPRRERLLSSPDLKKRESLRSKHVNAFQNGRHIFIRMQCYIYSNVLTFLHVRCERLANNVGLMILLIAVHQHLLRSFCWKRNSDISKIYISVRRRWKMTERTIFTVSRICSDWQHRVLHFGFMIWSVIFTFSMGKHVPMETSEDSSNSNHAQLYVICDKVVGFSFSTTFLIMPSRERRKKVRSFFPRAYTCSAHTGNWS